MKQTAFLGCFSTHQKVLAD